jgi:hypothetical protein
MLLKLTCPSCGRSTDALEHVPGKQLRCPCGNRGRVIALNCGAAQPLDPVHARASATTAPGRHSFSRVSEFRSLHEHALGLQPQIKP